MVKDEYKITKNIVECYFALVLPCGHLISDCLALCCYVRSICAVWCIQSFAFFHFCRAKALSEWELFWANDLHCNLFCKRKCLNKCLRISHQGVEAFNSKSPSPKELEQALKIAGVKWKKSDIEDFAAVLKKLVAHARTLRRKAQASTSNKIAILKQKIVTRSDWLLLCCLQSHCSVKILWTQEDYQLCCKFKQG